MKKIITAIITLFIIFSSNTNTFAEEWYIEKLLDLNYKVEQNDIDFATLKPIYFNNQENRRIYSELISTTESLKNLIMKNYREWKFSYYQASWIVKSYNYFIYHTNKYFSYLRTKELNWNYKEVDTAIRNSLINMRNKYKRVKYLISLSY